MMNMVQRFTSQYRAIPNRGSMSDVDIANDCSTGGNKNISMDPWLFLKNVHDHTMP
jgi:hypothetical protein